MSARLGHLLLALALLGATGGHWAVLQTVAWTQMIVQRSQSQPLPVVVAETISGEKPCALCKGIAAGKQSEKRAEFPATCVKLEFVCSTMVPLIFPQEIESVSSLPRLPSASRGEEPPVPPPRVHAV